MKKILFIVYCLFTFNAFAQVDHSQWETKEFKAYLKTSLADTLANARDKANTCANTAMNTDVSPDTITAINNVKLTESEATAALAYLAYKAQLACLGDLPLEAAGYLQLAQKLSVISNDANEPSAKSLKALLFDREQEIRFNYLFLKIAKDKRDALEKIEELKTPFNISVLAKIETVK